MGNFSKHLDFWSFSWVKLRVTSRNLDAFCPLLKHEDTQLFDIPVLNFRARNPPNAMLLCWISRHTNAYDVRSRVQTQTPRTHMCIGQPAPWSINPRQFFFTIYGHRERERERDHNLKSSGEILRATNVDVISQAGMVLLHGPETSLHAAPLVAFLADITLSREACWEATKFQLVKVSFILEFPFRTGERSARGWLINHLNRLFSSYIFSAGTKRHGGGGGEEWGVYFFPTR